MRRHAPTYGVVLGLIAAMQRVSRHSLLDRLIRGRALIVLVAFALIGIVTLQLALLKLNAGIGHSLERSAVLQRENAALSIENSELAAGSRVESTAVRQGMQLVSPGALRFLTARPHVDPSAGAVSLAAAPQVTGVSSAETSTSSSQAKSEAPASASSAEASSTASTPGEASSTAPAPSTTSTSPAEGTTPAAQAQSSPSPEVASAGEAGAPAGESPPSTPSSSAAASAAAAPAATPSEATSAGGTQAGPAG